MKAVIFLRRGRASATVQKSLDKILYELERYGRTVTTNGHASRYLSYRFQKQRHDNPPKIYFKWHKKNHSIITLHPKVKIEKISPNKIKFIYEEDFGEKKQKL